MPVPCRHTVFGKPETLLIFSESFSSTVSILLHRTTWAGMLPGRVMEIGRAEDLEGPTGGRDCKEGILKRI